MEMEPCALYFTPQNILMCRGTVMTGSDRLSTTKGEVLIGDSGKPLLWEGGHVVTEDDLSISNEGDVVTIGNKRIFGPDEQSATSAKSEKLLLCADGRPKLSSDGKLQDDIVRRSDGRPILGRDKRPIARRDLKFLHDDTLVDSHGRQIVGADGLLIMRGEILIGSDDKPILTPRGQFIACTVLAPGGDPISRQSSVQSEVASEGEIAAEHSQPLNCIHTVLGE